MAAGGRETRSRAKTPAADDGDGSAFGDDGATEGKRLIVSPESAGADLARFLRVQCIHRREPTLQQLAGLSGVKLKRLRRFLENDPAERRSPSLAEALSIWAVLQAPAANASLGRIGLVAEADEAEGERLTHATADLFEAGAVLARIAADGVVDQDEADDADRAADAVIARALVFKAGARRARAR